MRAIILPLAQALEVSADELLKYENKIFKHRSQESGHSKER